MPVPISYDGQYASGSMRSRHRAVTHNWDVVIDGASLPGELGTMATALRSGNTDVFNCNCMSVTVPNTNISTIEGNIRGVRFHQIQTRASTPIQTTLNFYEPYDYKLYKFFETWKSYMVDRWTGRQNPNAWITSGVSVVLYNHERNNPVIEYPLYDTYCISANVSDPSGAANLQQCSVILQSSNYGIVVYSTDGKPEWQDVPNEAKLLGQAGSFQTAGPIDV